MKKIMLIILAACSVLSLAACSNKNGVKVEEPISVENNDYSRDPALPNPYPMATEQPGDLPYSDEEAKHLSIAQKYPTIDMDNVFFESNEDEIKKIMKDGTGVVYFANAQDDWSQFLIYEINLACRAAGVDVNLYDLSAHLENADDEFILSLKEYLKLEGKETVKQPLVMFVVSGELQGYYTPEVDMKKTSPEDYYDTDKTIEVENKLYDLAMKTVLKY